MTRLLDLKCFDKALSLSPLVSKDGWPPTSLLQSSAFADLGQVISIKSALGKLGQGRRYMSHAHGHYLSRTPDSSTHPTNILSFQDLVLTLDFPLAP